MEISAWLRRAAAKAYKDSNIELGRIGIVELTHRHYVSEEPPAAATQ